MTDRTADQTPPPLGDTLVLFDWNGTLVVDPDRARRGLNRVLSARDLPELDAPSFAARFQLPMSVMFVALGVRSVEVADAEEEWNAAIAEEPAVARPGTVEALEALAATGALLGVVSAASDLAVGADLKRLDLRKRFHSLDFGVADKRAVLARRRGDRNFAYFVGDTVYDMLSALHAGYVAIGVVGGYTDSAELRAAGAVAIVDDLRELPELLID